MSRTRPSDIADPNRRSCKLCSEFDTVDMVQCDGCKKWFHFACVGVPRDIEKTEFFCTDCRLQNAMQSQVDVGVNDDQKSKISRGSSKSSTRRAHLNLQKIEEERRLTQIRDQEYLDKKYKALQEFVESSDDDGDRKSDTGLRDEIRTSTTDWVEAQRNLPFMNATNLEAFTAITRNPRLANFPYFDNAGPSDNWDPTTTADNGYRTVIGRNPTNVQMFGTPNDIESPTNTVITSHVTPTHVETYNASNVAENVTNYNASHGTLSFGNRISPTSVAGNSTQIPTLTTSSVVTSNMSQPSQTINFGLSYLPFGLNFAQSIGPQISQPSTHQPMPQVSLYQLNTAISSHQQLGLPVSQSFAPQFRPQSSAQQVPTSSLHFHPPPATQSNPTFAFQFGSQQAPSRGSQSVPPQTGLNSRVTSSTQVGPSSNLHGGQIPVYNFGSTQPTLNNSQPTGPQFINPNNLMVNSTPHASFAPGSRQVNVQVLTPSQIASRQVVPKKLPIFFGDIEKFPMFIKTYESSSKLCGYTDAENLSRLRESLKGVAYDLVEQQLFYPECVPNIIETLKSLYGRPEYLIEAQLQKIAKEPSPKPDDLPALVKYSIMVQNVCGTIKTAESPEHLNNTTLMKALVDKLPPTIQLNWALFKQSIGHANLDHLGTWLHELAKLASSIAGPPKVKRDPEKKKMEKSSGYVNTNVESNSKKNSAQTTKKCLVCNQNSCQQIQNCKKFVNLSVQERWSTVKEKQLCLRCLGYHKFSRCRSKQKCNTQNCQKAHHPMLHENESKTETSKSSANKNDDENNTMEPDGQNKTVAHTQSNDHSEIFRIVPVLIHNNENTIQTFAYLDEGSNLTMMDDSLATELGVVSESSQKICIKWAFKEVRRQSIVAQIVSIQVSGVYANAPKFQIHDVRTVDSLDLPSQTITEEWLRSFPYLKGIPVTPYRNGKPRILLGLRHSKLTVSRRTIERGWSEPIACKTKLGWVLQGPDDNGKSNSDSYSVNLCECQKNDIQLDKMVRQFFSWDNFDVKVTDKILESKEIQRARKILELTTVRKNGRYETGLLWRYDDVEFPNSYPMALKRLECLERNMLKNPTLAEKMHNGIREYIEKGYVRELTEEELKKNYQRTFYLPVFPVFNPKKPNKFRMVWDAAAKVNNISLNSMLLSGPDQLKPLPDVLRRFRERKYASTGDIGEMYHQVQVRKSDIHAQRFLWRDDPKDKPKILVMEVLTFGATSSPCSALYVKDKNAIEFKDKFSRAVEAITENHYMDDMLECSHTIDEAVSMINDVKFVHQQGGFEIRKFLSNSFEILERIGEQQCHENKNLNITDESTNERVLGMFWNTSTDEFTYSLKFLKINEDLFRGRARPTKREVLRLVMSIFDPLGLIAQVLVHGKILMQKLWREGIGWDDKLPDLLFNDWLTWMSVLPKVEELKIPRLLSPKLSPKTPNSIELHVFVDASIEACAAVAFYRIEDDEGVDCCLIGAKTKVAPNKPLSIPRLELHGAVLGTRLAQSIINSQRIQATNTFFWSDSQTVLAWIKSDARKYHQYVAFRIGEILENSSASQWNWIDTDSNVADDGTKWPKNSDFTSISRWYKGSAFLYQPKSEWNVKPATFTTQEEMRAIYVLAHLNVANNEVIDPTRFSNWNRLRRAMAFALRFTDNLRMRKKDRRVGSITCDEYTRAQNVLFKQAQREDFLEEILIIRNNESLPVGEKKELPKSSVLRTCSPYLDEDGLLRIRGRIDAARSLEFKTKRPIILPRHNYITKLVVYSYHQKFHHQNHQTTLNEIKQMFYIPALRVVLKSIIENLCQRCKNDRSKPVVPEMAELPLARLSAFTRPFTYVGVDYFGPVNVKVRRYPEKRWGVIFTCLTTRAVYIDVAHTMDTSSCIFCIRNFSNRNGQPLEYHSDNGLYFRAADKELHEEFQKLDKAKIEETFTNEHTRWFFNPPTAAHMGGVWERLIRTVKSVLKKSMPTRLPTDEMLRSYLIEIENILNSRPLTYVQLDDIDDEVLTPNHFLRGSSNGLKSPGTFNPKHLLRDDWKAVQELTNRFWKQFVVEYLPTLTRRTKWFKDVKPIEVGDVVIDIDEGSDRNEWRKGIVEEIALVKGKIRRAKVRMIRGEKAKISDKRVEDITHQSLWRPVAKLAVLDVKNSGLSSSPKAVNREGNVVNAP